MIKILRLILITLSFTNLYSQKISGNYIVTGVTYRAGDGNYRSNFIYDIFVSLDTKGNLKITSYQFLSVLSDEKFFAETAEIKNPHFNREKLNTNGIKGISYYGDIVNTKNGNYSFISVNFTVLVLENEIVGMYINKSHGNKKYLLMLKPIKKTETVNIKELSSINKVELSTNNYKENILEYYENGKVKKKQVDNITNNSYVLTTYFEGGGINYIYNYKNDLLNGVKTEYNEKGLIESKITFLDGKRNGECKYYSYMFNGYSSKGQMSWVRIEKGNYKDDLKEGIWTYSNSDCKDPKCVSLSSSTKILRKNNYFLGQLHGEQIEYDYNSGKISHKTNYKHGYLDE